MKDAGAGPCLTFDKDKTRAKAAKKATVESCVKDFHEETDLRTAAKNTIDFLSALTGADKSAWEITLDKEAEDEKKKKKKKKKKKPEKNEKKSNSNAEEQRDQPKDPFQRNASQVCLVSILLSAHARF